jgi:superfamily II DNA/RNA helicase
MNATNNVDINAILKSQNFEKLNPMQQEVFALDKSFQDLIVLSPTGSGKTLAYLLRLLSVLDSNAAHVQAVIISPTRELVIQIETVFRSLKTGYSSCVCYGGHDSRTEQNRLSETPDVIIGTPGRLVDHILKGRIDLSNLAMVILDEFDKSLEMGFLEEIELIFKNMKGKPNLVLTSATNLEKIPAFIPIKKEVRLNYLSDTSENKLEQLLINCPAEEKAEAVMNLVTNFGDELSLIFCNHRDAVERISLCFKELGLQHGIFHGGLEQIDRERNLIKFRTGACNVLISTDLAARGLDIPEIKNVIHYQLPVHEDAFIHRNGRTARMNASGLSYLLLGSDEDLPHYVPGNLKTFKLAPSIVKPKQSAFECIYFSAGKKDKISKGDVVGLLMKKGALENKDIGLITITDIATYVGVNRQKANSLIKALRGEKLKKAKVKVEVAR